MAFARSALALQASGGYAKIWTYESADAAAVVLADDYFLTCYRELKAGDLILCRLGVGGTLEFYIAMVALSSATDLNLVVSLPMVAFSALGTDLLPIIDPP